MRPVVPGGPGGLADVRFTGGEARYESGSVVDVDTGVCSTIGGSLWGARRQASSGAGAGWSERRCRGSPRASMLDFVRLTEFHELMHTEFGVHRADAMLADHVIPVLGRTGAAAIEAGVDPRDVWRALCAEFDVPRSRW